MQDQNNRYRNYGYDNYDAPQGQGGRQFRAGDAAKILRSPLAATLLLLAGAAVFVWIIIASYSGAPDEDTPVAVVSADAGPFKTEPESRGGMEVPYQDSTVFNTLRANQDADSARVENLLDDGEDIMDREAVFSAMEEELNEGFPPQPGAEDIEPAAGENQGDIAALDEAEEDETDAILRKVEGELKSPQSAPSVEQAQDSAALKMPGMPKPEIGETRTIRMEKVEQAAPDQAAAQVKPEKLHSPGTSPETLNFVRNVLDRKDGMKALDAPAAAAASEPQKTAAIEPASGTPGPEGTGSAGHFVQLGSVKSETGAAEEWKRLQKDFTGELGGIDYRVQRADLGERGIFYRIQAGPFSKARAEIICESIRAQKPGGCLVVR